VQVEDDSTIVALVADHNDPTTHHSVEIADPISLLQVQLLT
jgi:hypothetical protein